MEKKSAVFCLCMDAMMFDGKVSMRLFLCRVAALYDLLDAAICASISVRLRCRLRNCLFALRSGYCSEMAMICGVCSEMRSSFWKRSGLWLGAFCAACLALVMDRRMSDSCLAYPLTVATSCGMRSQRFLSWISIPLNVCLVLFFRLMSLL